MLHALVVRVMLPNVPLFFPTIQKVQKIQSLLLNANCIYFSGLGLLYLNAAPLTCSKGQILTLLSASISGFLRVACEMCFLPPARPLWINIYS